MAAITVILIATLEYLSQKSARAGGIVLANIHGGFSALQSFSLLYLPTILSVCFSIAWSWIDLDAKRLEPFFQLSKAEGALAEQSILLQYPIEYLPLIPIKAARSR